MKRLTIDRERRGGGRPATPSSHPRSFPAQLFPQIVAILLAIPIAGSAWAASGTITVSAVVLSKSVCKFRSSSAFLDFGMLDPGNAVDVTTVTSLEFRCMGSAPITTYAVTGDDGMHETGPNANRMQHLSVPTEYLPYSMVLSPDSGMVPKGEYRTLTISGTVRGTDYGNAFPGSYSDGVVITINP